MLRLHHILWKGAWEVSEMCLRPILRRRGKRGSRIVKCITKLQTGIWHPISRNVAQVVSRNTVMCVLWGKNGKNCKVCATEYCLSKECGSAASAINGKCHKYDEYSKREKRTWNHKICHKVTNRSMVPKWYTRTSHRLWAGVQYPGGTRQYAGIIAQVVSRK